MPLETLSLAPFRVDPSATMRQIVAPVPATSLHILDAEPTYELVLPFELLGVFCRHYETGVALQQVGLYALAEFGFDGLPPVPVAEPQPDRDGPAEAPADPFAPFRKRVRFPLGVVVTDHAGYASFDLGLVRSEVLRAAIDEQLAPLTGPLGELADSRRGAAADIAAPPRIAMLSLKVIPYLDPALTFEAMADGDVAPNFIVLRIQLDENDLAERGKDIAGASMQRPSILDWRLSPSSFTMAKALLIGEDGCETLLPTSLATQRFTFRQIIRAPAGRGGSPDGVSFAYVAEYATEWLPIGHSLGQILYSLPLAPGEKVKIAIVDWSRQDRAGRDETSVFTEQLSHRELRDRSVSETVEATLREWQSGSSIMGGMATSAGASIPLGIIDIGAGMANSIGASSASTEGGRDVTGETMQQITDGFSQASTAIRELKSTIVVQSEQAEQSKVETRVVANYNRGHALTMIYYEVLRHYRVVTRLERISGALLAEGVSNLPVNIGGPGGEFTAGVVLGKRLLLERALLDPRYLAMFESAAKVAQGEAKLARDHAIWAASGQTVDEGATLFSSFNLQVTTGSDDTDEPLFLVLRANVGGVEQEFEQGAGEIAEEGTSARVNLVFGPPVAWSNITEFEVRMKDVHFGDASWTPTSVSISGVTPDGTEIQLVAASLGQEIDDDDGTGGLSVIPPRAPETVFPTPEPKRQDYVTAEDDFALFQLLAHLNDNRAHYVRVLYLTEDPNARIDKMQAKLVDGIPLIDLVDGRAIETFGDALAFPIAPARLEQLRDHFDAPRIDESDALSFVEQLLSLPTRGVFGEAKLGHCDAAEIIDTSRYTDWATANIPDSAPEIVPVEGAPQGTPLPAPTPTAFPQSIVNIATPQGLPDPTGLGGAFTLMGALGAFKDLSGQEELAGLLGTLSNNATKLASEGLGLQNKKRLMDMINSSDLTKDQKTKLIGSLLGSAVEEQKKPAGGQAPSPAPNPNPNPTPNPTPNPNPNPTPNPNPGGGNNPGGGGNATPPPTPAPAPKPEKTVTNKTGFAQLNFILSGFEEFLAVSSAWGSISGQAVKDGVTDIASEQIQPGAPVGGLKMVQCVEITGSGNFALDVQLADPGRTVLSARSPYTLTESKVARIYIRPKVETVEVQAASRGEAVAKAEAAFTLGGPNNDAPVKTILLSIADSSGATLADDAQLEEGETYKFRMRMLARTLIVSDTAS